MIHDNPREAFVDYGCRAEDFDEAFVGVYDSEEQFALEMGELMFGSDNPVIKAGYFDAEAYAITLFSCDYFSIDAPGVRVYVFRSV